MSASDVLSASRRCACSFSFTCRSLCSLSSASTDSLVSSSTTASPRSTRAPGRLRIRSTRASTGLDRTRSISGTIGARGHDHRVDGAGRHAGGADAGARHAGPQQVGQPGEEQHHRQDRHDGDHDADADPAASFGGGNLAIHASRIVKARARSRAPGSATYQRLTGGRRRPASSSVRTVVRKRTPHRRRGDAGRWSCRHIPGAPPPSRRGRSREVSQSHHCSCGVTLAFFNAGGRTEHAATVASTALSHASERHAHVVGVRADT